MRSSNNLLINVATRRRCVAPAFAAFLASAFTILPAVADPCAQVAEVEAINADSTGGSTVLDIDIDGRTIPAIAYSGKSVTVTLPGAKPNEFLAKHMSTGGLIDRIAFEPGTPGGQNAQVRVGVAEESEATLMPSLDSHTVRVRIGPATAANQNVAMQQKAAKADLDTEASATAPAGQTVAQEPTPNDIQASEDSGPGPKTYAFDAFDADVQSLLKSLATQAGVDIVFTGAITGKATVHFASATVDQAVDLLTKSAGLNYYKQGNTYFVGAAKDLGAAFPSMPPAFTVDHEIYQCHYVMASSLAATLANVFDPHLLRVALGASAASPHMGDSTGIVLEAGQTSSGSSGGSGGSSGMGMGGTSSSTGSSGMSGSTGSSLGSPGGSSGSPSISPSTGSGSMMTRMLILSGDQNTVAQALALAQKLDIRRKQVKINVKISDVSTTALKQLGIQWAISQFAIGGGNSSPISVDATVSALEDKNLAKVLADPSISLLDGETGSILIGTRVLYPVLEGYSSTNTPIYDVAEEPVGISLQVALQMDNDDEMTLNIYPQVSSITGYLSVSGASYPQVSTREQQTTVRVKNGQEIVIGGLINNEDIAEDQRVPILSGIPFFGELFKYHNREKDGDEVIVTIQPTVLDN